MPHCNGRPRADWCVLDDVRESHAVYVRRRSPTNAGADAQTIAACYSPSMKRRVSQESLPGPMQRMAMRPRAMQKSVRPSCMAGQNP
jgi:hypothetical protein